jgi:hypothetical protein
MEEERNISEAANQRLYGHVDSMVKLIFLIPANLDSVHQILRFVGWVFICPIP